MSYIEGVFGGISMDLVNTYYPPFYTNPFYLDHLPLEERSAIQVLRHWFPELTEKAFPPFGRAHDYHASFTSAVIKLTSLTENLKRLTILTQDKFMKIRIHKLKTEIGQVSDFIEKFGNHVLEIELYFPENGPKITMSKFHRSFEKLSFLKGLELTGIPLTSIEHLPPSLWTIGLSHHNLTSFDDDDFYKWTEKFCKTGHLLDHALPQSEYFIGVEYDYVLKFESLNDDFKNMCVELGIDPELGHHNKSGFDCKRCVEDLSQKSIEMINKKYIDDFTKFGYKFI